MRKKEPKYKPDKTYIVVAKFEIKGREIEKFIPRLKSAKLYWVEEPLNATA